MCDNCVPLRITFLASISLVLLSQSFFYLIPLFADWGQFAKNENLQIFHVTRWLVSPPSGVCKLSFYARCNQALWYCILIRYLSAKTLEFSFVFLPPTCHIFSLRQCCHSFPEGLFNLHCYLEGSVKPLLVYVNFLFGKGKLIYFCNF